MSRSVVSVVAITACFVAVCQPPRLVSGAEITSKRVLDSIARAKRYLQKSQQEDGSWRAVSAENFRTGISSLVMLALFNSGMTTNDLEIQKGLQYLRTVKEPDFTYECSLMIMALAAAKDERRDKARIMNLVKRLEDAQIRAGENAGTWGYGAGNSLAPNLGGDRSNGQFAVLGLHEAQDAGIPVSLDTLRRARDHWKLCQNADGGWGYSGRANQTSSGSMTVAGISTMVITEAMVRQADKELNPDGSPRCCTAPEPDQAVENGVKWLGKNFSVGHNPREKTWLLYYLYGLERAGRLSGRRFFGEAQNRHDWYREGAEYLVERQLVQNGSWQGVGSMENDPIVGTSLALLFLSKGLSPVLINKLDYSPAAAAFDDGGEWNRHRNDVRNLTQMISGLPQWPKLITWQVVQLRDATVDDLLQAPVLFLNGENDPKFSQQDAALLKEYVAQGGFIFAESCCQGTGFDRGFRDLIKQMYPPSETRLKQLDPDHPIYRSEYLLDASTVELWGCDIGCRTSIVYSPRDLSCLWDKWTVFEMPNRPAVMTSMITKATQVGVNVVAYATGREPPTNRLDRPRAQEITTEGDGIQRGLLEIAKLRYTGSWDAAPQALRNLLSALNTTAGVATAHKAPALTPLDPAIFKYPLLYIHGRNMFQISPQERDQIRKYIERGGVLFADACCGAPQFDKGFRQMIEQMFPDHKLQRIPPTHEIFTTAIGNDLSRVKRREPEVNDANAALKATIRTVEPYLEGVEMNGRFVVIYSKYDISCALERQAAVSCTGYIREDAVRIAVNIVLYALLQ